MMGSSGSVKRKRDGIESDEEGRVHFCELWQGTALFTEGPREITSWEISWSFNGM